MQLLFFSIMIFSYKCVNKSGAPQDREGQFQLGELTSADLEQTRWQRRELCPAAEVTG